jgi:integrase
MPKVERLPSGSYRIRYTDPWGRRAVITQPTAADVRAAYKNIVSAMARGEYVDPRHGRTTVSEWAEEWLEGARNVGPGGRDIYRQALDHIIPELGKIPLGKLSAGDIDRYIALKLDTLAPSTVHRHYRTIHRMLAVAVDRGMIARNPCEHVQPPKVPRRELTPLTVDQVDALADAITPRYRAWVYVAAYGGLRWSETVGLRRRNVEVESTPGGGFLDLSQRSRAQHRTDTSSEQGDALHTNHRGAGGRPERSLSPALSPASRESPLPTDGPSTIARIRVVEQLVRRRDGTWDRCEPKVGSRRTVTLPGFAAGELAAHLDEYSLPGDDGLVFPTSRGTPMQGPSWSSNTFRRALAKAGLPRIRVHDLRHTSVSLALDAGGRLEVVQERHGHSSIRVTADTYSHRYAGADAAVADALDELHARAQRARLRAV